MRRFHVVAPLVSIAALFATGALAWGPEGHAIVAEIAESRLTPTAAAQVQQLLALENHQHLDQVSSWPDAYRVQHPETGPWHFVDVPLDAAGYDAARDCAGGNCVVMQIQHFAGVLGDSSASPQDRLAALKYVTHFAGDIAQPLHAEDDHDKGGNDVKLSFRGKHTNLHAVWDGGIIEAALGVQLGPNYAPDLGATQAEAGREEQAITAAAAAAWAPPGTAQHLDTATVAWANESHQLAVAAYHDLPSDRTAGWDEAYKNEEWPVIQGQLERGGVRLAEILNEELK